MIRPAILTENKKLSEYVKYLITDRNKNKIVGVVMEKDNKIIIEFLDVVSPVIIWDRKGKEFSFEVEFFNKDPKEVLNKLED